MSGFLSQDRLTLLLALVPFLIDNDGVSVDEAAAHFGVSPEEVRRAVELIAVSGVPGETMAYLHGDLFDIDWDALENEGRITLTNLVAIDDSPRFSAREAAALVAGLQYLQSLPEFADHAAIGVLMGKLTRGASSTPTAVAVAPEEADASVAVIRDAISRGTQLEFDYLSGSGERGRRRVDPLRLESADDIWYLRAWCHLREAVRTFRLDRMTALEALEEPVTGRAGEQPQLPDALFTASDDDLAVELRLSRTALPVIAAYLGQGAVTEEGDEVRASIRVAHYNGLKRLVASNAGVLTVTAPDEARAEVASWARAALDRYESLP